MDYLIAKFNEAQRCEEHVQTTYKTKQQLNTSGPKLAKGFQLSRKTKTKTTHPHNKKQSTHENQDPNQVTTLTPTYYISNIPIWQPQVNTITPHNHMQNINTIQHKDHKSDRQTNNTQDNDTYITPATNTKDQPPDGTTTRMPGMESTQVNKDLLSDTSQDLNMKDRETPQGNLHSQHNVSQ